MGPHLRVETGGGIARVTFDRPESFNALDEEMATGLVAALQRAAVDDDVRMVLVTGTGPAFCAGVELSGDDPVQAFDSRTMDGAAAIARTVATLPKPVVVAVNGVAAGIGASLCFAADLAVATESASFLLAFSQVGLMPDGAASLTVAASVGRARAMRMALLGESLSAREAYDAGLISHVAADAEYDDLVERVCRRLVNGPPLAFAATKKAVNAAVLSGLEDALEREHRGQLVLFGTDDAAEGMRAFVQRRRPVFIGS